MKFKLNFLNYAAAPFLRLASNLEDQDGISERSMWELHWQKDIFSTYFNVYTFTLTKHNICVYPWKVALYDSQNILQWLVYVINGGM